MSNHATAFFQVSHVRPLSRLTLAHRVTLMWDAVRTRRILAEMEPRLLKDIGVSRSEAEAEAARAPWDIGPRG